ncbi:hypothetical protein Pfo_029644 [Paulownia fortunei]|nr:hypothetical protein Pfo_029644 [Paulownia fortunei]
MPPPKHTSPTHHCVKCNAICGSMWYKCPDSPCGIQLDVLCALTIRILHRSHEHRLTAIRGTASFICGACGTQHRGRRSSPVLFYLCSYCDFWIHTDCASLPNAIIIIHEKHQHTHPLVLNYALPTSYGPEFSMCYCKICGDIIQRFGVYFCGSCRYYVHVKCAISDPNSFKPVLIRDAKLPNLLRFPIADERTSVMRYIIENTSGGTSSSSSDHEGNVTTHDHQSDGKLYKDRHEHPLIFHDQDDDHPGVSRVCSACVQSISPPFYSCCECRDLFLHSCCVHLPVTLTKHPAHQDHSLFLLTRLEPPISGFFCEGCWLPCNGFAYCCKTCDFYLDVVCAFMPASITHDAHGKAHILYAARNISEPCPCCGNVYGGISYECHTCRSFKLHARCALFPDTVRHKFDQHPLKLITTSKRPPSVISQDQLEHFCEICEQDIDNKCWYYSCDRCDQSFHTDCIPFLDRFSRMRLGITVDVQCHDCPVTSVRALTVYGYRCGYCQEIMRESEGVAFECSKCYFRIHLDCASKCFKEDVD